MPPPSPPPAAALMEELIEEVLLRLPPDEPASLFCASLVCKPWCRLISGPRFRRRYREFHRTPPMLGFLCGMLVSGGVQTTRFMPTSAFCSPLAERRCRLVDARHGRVLLLRSGEPGRENVLLVWDPITDEEREIPFPKLTRPACTWKAAVVCAATAGGACDHLDCHRGSFLVVLVISYSPETFIWTYSSNAGSWSDPIFTQQHGDGVDFFFPSVFVGNALYFEFWSTKRVLKYDLEFQEMSVIGLPLSFGHRVGVFRTTEDGRLGFATAYKSKLYMWSRKHGPEADAVWTRDRVIELETLLSSNAILTEPLLVGFVDRIGVILLRADNALFTVDLKTSKVKKVCDGASSIVTVVPYMSFYTPGNKGRPASIEDKIVSLLPNFPCRNGENLHEEGALILKLRLIHHLKEFQREIPANSKMLPTRLTERAAEEQMESRFFSIVVAEHTIIVVSLEFLLFSSKNISSVKPIHEEEPREDSKLITAFGVPDPKKRSWGLRVLVGQVVAFR